MSVFWGRALDRGLWGRGWRGEGGGLGGLGGEGKGRLRWGWSRVFYPHDSFVGAMAAGDSVAPELLQRDLLVGQCEAAGGRGEDRTWNKATRRSPSGGARFSQPGCGRKRLGEEGREADVVSPPLPPPSSRWRAGRQTWSLPSQVLASRPRP